MKFKTKIKLGAVGIVGGIAAGVAFNKLTSSLVDAYLSRSSIKKEREKAAAKNIDTDFHESRENLLGQLFYATTPRINISIPNRNGRHINAILFKQEEKSPKYAILCHGYRSSAKTLGYMARHYFEQGYNVLVPYLRAHDGSDYNYCTMGWHERLDIVDWVDYVDRTAAGAQIVLHGVSMGAATVMMTTGEALPSSVRACIDDCGFTSVYDVYKFQIPNALHIPSYPAIEILRSAIKRRVGFDIKEASALEQVRRSRIPTLFIHGTADTVVPFHMVEELYASAACEKEKLVFKGSAHSMCPIDHPEEYWNKVFEFIEKHNK